MPHIDSTISIILVAVVAVITMIVVVLQGKGSSKLEELKADELLRQGHLERQKGNYVQQEYALQKALEILGPKGDFTKRSSCLVHLIDSYTKQGKLQEARTISQEMIKYWRSQMGNPTDALLKDFDYFVATADFASATFDVAEFYRIMPDTKKKIFGPNHSEVADSYMLLSRLHARLGDKQAAAHFEAEANAVRSGSYNPGTAGGAAARFPDAQGNQGEIIDVDYEVDK
jgi:pentatricopeptide repeat protein